MQTAIKTCTPTGRANDDIDQKLTAVLAESLAACDRGCTILKSAAVRRAKDFASSQGSGEQQHGWLAYAVLAAVSSITIL